MDYKIPKIPPSLKTSVLKEWMEVFPELSKYTSTMLYCRKGPIVIGLEFQWLMGNEEYRPYYQLRPLQPNIKENSFSSCFMYPLRFNERTLSIKIEEKSLSCLLKGSKEEIRSYLLQQCIIPFNQKTDTKEIAKCILAECKRENALSIYGNLFGAYHTLLMLGGLLRKEDPGFAKSLFDYAIEKTKQMNDDKYTKWGMEQAYNKPFDEVIELLTYDYHNVDYEKVIEETVQKFKLDKLKSL
jgi:hypothetical protein